VTALVDHARDAGASIVYTRDVHPPEQFDDTHYYDEFDRWGEHVVEGSWDAELVAELDVRDEDHIVEKHTYDAFYQTDLGVPRHARHRRPADLRDARQRLRAPHRRQCRAPRDYRPVVVEDALGYITEDHREYAVEHADWLFGETATHESIGFESA